MKGEVPRTSGKDTLLRRLALEKVRELRRAGMSYREIGLRFHPRRGCERVCPAGAAESPAPPHPSADPGTTIDHWFFLRALDGVPVGLFFFDQARRVVHANEQALRMLDMDPGGEQIRREIDAFLYSLCPPGQSPPLSISSRGVQEIAARETSTAAGTYRLRGSFIGLDLWGIGGTLLITLESADPEPISPEAVREWFALTRREAQVALLLAERKSTPEIARELHSSPHTIRHHVRRVLAKLGIHSRRAVAAALEAGRNRRGGKK